MPRRCLECYSVNEGSEPTSFRLDYDKIRELEAGADYDVEAATDNTALLDPDCAPLSHGTRITLSRLRLRRALNEVQFPHIALASVLRLVPDEMRIHVNGDPVGALRDSVGVSVSRALESCSWRVSSSLKMAGVR